MSALLLLVLTKLKNGASSLYSLLKMLNFVQGALFLLGLILGYKFHGAISLLLKILRIL